MRYMLGSGAGMAIGDRPLNVMQVRKERAPRAILVDGSLEPPARFTPLTEIDHYFAMPAPRLRGLQLQELEGGWL